MLPPDTEAALASSWAADRSTLESAGCPRDFVDTLACDSEVQPLGYLAWAACGKDPGFSPTAILELAARSARYSKTELRGLDFEGEAPAPYRGEPAALREALRRGELRITKAASAAPSLESCADWRPSSSWPACS